MHTRPGELTPDMIDPHWLPMGEWMDSTRHRQAYISGWKYPTRSLVPRDRKRSFGIVVGL